jgi:hypothetical protein
MVEHQSGTQNQGDSAIEQALRRILSGESDAEVIPGPTDGELHLTRDPLERGIVRVQGAGGGVDFDGVAFRRSHVRPPGYPEHVLFLADSAAFVMDLKDDQGFGGYVVIWWDVGDSEVWASRIEQDCMASGWTKLDGVPEPFVMRGAVQSCYAKVDAARIVTNVATKDGNEAVMLTEITVPDGAGD